MTKPLSAGLILIAHSAGVLQPHHAEGAQVAAAATAVAASQQTDASSSSPNIAGLLAACAVFLGEAAHPLYCVVPL